MMLGQNFEIDVNEKSLTGKNKVRFTPFILFILLILVILGVIASLAVFFIKQGQQLSILAQQIEVLNVSIACQNQIWKQQQQAAFGNRTNVASTTAVSLPAIPWESYRLPDTAIPSHYKIHIQAFLPFDESEENMTGAFTTSGKTEITFITIRVTDVIILHALNLNVSTENVSVLFGGKSIAAVAVAFDELRHLLKIKLVEQLSPGKSYQLVILYEGLIADDCTGLYRSSYLYPNGTKRWLAVTQFQSYGARQAFPCFDEPSFRATFEITLKYDSRFTGTYTIRNATTTKQVGNLTEREFERTGKMPTYLLAILISDFDRNVSFTPDGLEFGVLTRKGVLSDATFAKTIGMNMTGYIGELLNISYGSSNTKLDMVAAPDFLFGGMENWGLIIYHEAAMLYRPGASAESKIEVARTVSHELAHQWFGDLITCSWWSELFLNEGFATYMEYPILQKTMPEWKMDMLFTTTVTTPALEMDASERTMPLYNPDISTPAEITAAVGLLTYNKGGAVIRMMEGVMGKIAFYSALKTYLRKNRSTGIVTYKDLLECLTENVEETPINMTEKFGAWITTSGFPLVTVTRNMDNTSITVQQERFQVSGNLSANVSNQLWHIPFSVKSSESNLTEIAAENAVTKAHVVPKEAKWVLANMEQYGFYRVHYDDQNWDALIEQLHTNHTVIPVLNRVQLIDDSFALARKNLVPYRLPLSLLARYLSDETAYPPWLTALNCLQYIVGMLGEHNSTKQFMSQLLKNRYRSSIWNSVDVWRESEHEDYHELMLRSNIIEASCYFEVSTCISEARDRFIAWKNGNGSVLIDSHFIDRILCYGIRSGSTEDFEYMVQQYGEADLETAKFSFLAALTCTKSPELQLRLLNLTSLGIIVKPLYRPIVFHYLARFPESVQVAWNFLKTHWVTLSWRYDVISYLCAAFNTPELLSELDKYHHSGEPDSSDKIVMEHLFAKVRMNIQWMGQHSVDVMETLPIYSAIA